MTNEPFTIIVTNDGKVTYPAGCSNIWEAQRAVETRLNARYEERTRQEHEQQLKPVPTKQQEYRHKEAERRAIRHENLCLVNACETHSEWKPRLAFLKALGYEYKGTYRSVIEKLKRKVNALTETGEYESLLKMMKGQGAGE